MYRVAKLNELPTSWCAELTNLLTVQVRRNALTASGYDWFDYASIKDESDYWHGCGLVRSNPEEYRILAHASVFPEEKERSPASPIIVHPAVESVANQIAGNVLLYGSTFNSAPTGPRSWRLLWGINDGELEVTIRYRKTR